MIAGPPRGSKRPVRTSGPHPVSSTAAAPRHAVSYPFTRRRPRHPHPRRRFRHRRPPRGHQLNQVRPILLRVSSAHPPIFQAPFIRRHVRTVQRVTIQKIAWYKEPSRPSSLLHSAISSAPSAPTAAGLSSASPRARNGRRPDPPLRARPQPAAPRGHLQARCHLPRLTDEIFFDRGGAAEFLKGDLLAKFERISQLPEADQQVVPLPSRRRHRTRRLQTLAVKRPAPRTR